jgi:hypothetical protein
MALECPVHQPSLPSARRHVTGGDGGDDEDAQRNPLKKTKRDKRIKHVAKIVSKFVKKNL